MANPTRHRLPRSQTASTQSELSRAHAEVVRLRTALAQVNNAADLPAAKQLASAALVADNRAP